MRAALLALLIAAACSEAGDAADAGAPQEVPVRTAAVTSHAFRETARGVGRLEAAETAEIRGQVAALVESLHFKDGQRVEQGDLLVTLDDDVLQRRLNAQRAALRASRARLTNLRDEFGRQERLQNRGVGSEAALDRARAEMRAAAAEVERLRAEVALAARQIEDTQVRAPFTGTVSEREVDVGDLVQPGTLLTTLYREGRLEGAFAVSESDAPQIHEGSPVELRIDGVPEPLEGQVIFVAPAARPGSHDVPIKAELGAAVDGLRPGLFVTARVVLEAHPERPTVPEKALVGTREGYIVFVVEDGEARRRDVDIGLRESGRVEIREGLSAGETVVVEGQMRLSDGTPVRVLEPDRAGRRDGGREGRRDGGAAEAEAAHR